MNSEVVGRASAVVRGDQVWWRFSCLGARLAAVVAGLLGGTPGEASGGWEVVTAASGLRAEVITASDAGLRFTLATAPDVGAFELRLAPWGVAGVLGDAAGELLAVLPVMVELSARVGEFTTLGGRLLRFAVPRLALCA
ncbi:hypothetical protein P3T35_000900 [Kitasatospora sp. GP30]|uniref:hypothetical protein n=1 Tax=Kitasatospora sp. GP30 TaxID=3035084 RepID=UPI000C7153D0|nr:hypothetical protein [Kitasatospora sp. GP30]MDH6138911.1 hypothetical protein [Kitasatospora sp. GP30]